MRWTMLIVVLAAVVAGCGGGESASLTHAEWAKRADAACKRAGTAIVKRGWAEDLRALQTVSSDAATDVRRAIAEIRRLPVPETAAARVRPFVADLGNVDALLDNLIRASTATDKGDLQAIATHVGGTLSALGPSAREAGLHWCLQHGEHRMLQDGIRAPLAADELARIDSSFPRLKNSSPRALRRLWGDLHNVSRELARIDPPSWARDEMEAYKAAVDQYAFRAFVFQERVAAGQTRPGPHFVRASAAVGRTHNRLTKALGAAPVGVADAVPDESA
jgi:hypothetical protein